MTAGPREIASVTMLLSGSDDLRDTAAAFIAERTAFDPADLLHRYASSIRTLEVAQSQMVSTLRAQGASWTTVGQALGVSKQAAQQRFG